jgi:hypothetical protein
VFWDVLVEFERDTRRFGWLFSCFLGGVSKENELWVDFEEAIWASKTRFWAVFFNFS